MHGPHSLCVDSVIRPARSVRSGKSTTLIVTQSANLVDTSATSVWILVLKDTGVKRDLLIDGAQWKKWTVQYLHVSS